MNEHNVPVYTDRGAMFWALVLPSRARTCEDQATGMIDHCEQLYGTFEDFLTPTEIEFFVHCFPQGQELPVTVTDEERLQAIECDLRDENGIQLTEVVDAARVSQQCSRWIPRIGFSGNQVLVELEAGRVYADRTMHTAEYVSGKLLDREPTRDPLEIVLLHSQNTSHPEIDSDYVTSVIVSPLSDVWFEDTEIGGKNRRHLSSFLERIDESLPVEVVERTSDWLPVDELEAVF